MMRLVVHSVQIPADMLLIQLMQRLYVCVALLDSDIIYMYICCHSCPSINAIGPVIVTLCESIKSAKK
jgi:hypothetical protein